MARKTIKDRTRHPQALQLLRTVKDLHSRNIMRGLLNGGTPRQIVDDLNIIRTKIGEQDLSSAIQLTLGVNGLYGGDETPKYYATLAKIHSLDAKVPSDLETAFVCFHINSLKEKCLALIAAISTFNDIEALPAAERLEHISDFYDLWGISEFLNKKLVFYMSIAEAEPDIVQRYRQLTERMKLDEAPEPHFAAMELMNDKYPYFKVVKTWVDILRNRQEDDFRQYNALDYMCPMPLCDIGVAAFLRKALATSIVDELIALKVILSLEDELPESSKRVVKDLDADILESLKSIGQTESVCRLLLLDSKDTDELQIYRRSLAFLEYSALVRHRYIIDQVLAPRLMPSRFIVWSRADRPEVDEHQLRLCLISKDQYYPGFTIAPFKTERQTFTKTVEFLAYLKLFPHKASFDEAEIRFIFDRTTALQYLITDEELTRLHNLACELGRRIISVLALALMKEKTQDEDTDFLFRSELQSTILESFDGSILSFFENLLVSDLNIAQFLASSLDRHTMQKLYMLIGSAAEADDLRHQILRRLGERMDHLPYVIEADRIRAHNQITKLKTEIDDSRVYVDGLSFKRWIRENPSSYMREYRRLLEQSLETITKAATFAAGGHLETIDAEIEILSKFDYVLRKAMETIFSQFCTNRLFGIDSYLGRRIRHNTLQGMMLGGVESIINGFPSIRIDGRFMRRYDQWLIEYRKMIENLRVDLLQFKGDNYKRAIFFSNIETSSFSTSKSPSENL